MVRTTLKLATSLVLGLPSAAALAQACDDNPRLCDAAVQIPTSGVLELAGIGAAVAVAIALFRRRK